MPVSNFTEAAVQRFTELDPFPQPPLVKVRYPVVMMHGFGMLASLRRKGHLHAEAMHLRLHGIPAYAPNVAPYNTVAARSTMWEERLKHVLEETGAEKLNLIAHSMGGLDARHLISQKGLHEVIASLTTISTPHRGSGIASLMLKQPTRLRETAADLINWFGATTLTESTSDVLQALSELTPVHMKSSFNPDHPNHPDVRYWSYAGAAGQGTEVPVNPFLRLLNRALHKREGPNDGFVSVQSAQWGRFMRTVPADHAQQVGLRNVASGPFDANDFYLSIARHLVEEGL